MSLYTISNPFLSRIKHRTLINKEGSSKKTYYLILDLKDSDISFESGDSLAILPQNDPRIVDLTLNYMRAKPDEEIEDPRTNQKIKLIDFLTKKANISKTTSNLIRLFTKKLNPDEMKELILSHHLWDILKKFPKHKIPAQEICNLLLPILPRLYSITSSNRMHTDELHLLITHVSYELSGIKRNGVATEFICHLSKVLKTPLPVYVQPSHGFTLTKDTSKPIIMIASGCGLAPYKAFLEDRYLDNAKENWLIFGERHSKTDFYFEDFFKDLIEKNLLRLTTAFSRDQEDKIYVQDRILENGSDIWQWIHSGAIIYICGGLMMGRKVDEAMQQIFMQEGNLSNGNARSFFKNLIKEKRYLKDVY
ncbi:MAG: Sulfite reductase [NADPH] flavoprotein alpha-component [Candidatus Anoxychlamydiales bacterium]|nr:Sulfite reductase [NADPH] flavoprotein alpha-component [Candidatus Anoxychlamydiales bacterium]